MLSAVFSFKLPEISSSKILRDLIRSFAIERPVPLHTSPSWDLDVVLKSLASSSYEPLSSLSLRSLTKKTLFLVALATAKRVGELQALASRVAFQGKDLVVSYSPHFVAKTETESNRLPRHFVIPALSSFAPDFDESSWLCPVRAVRAYLDLTKKIPARASSLFISPKRPTRPLSKNAISFFLRETISGAGALRVSEGRLLRAHSIRGVSTSVAFFKNCSVSKVLEAATWRSNSIFASFYLKDIQYVFDNCKSLGPVVAAGTVLDLGGRPGGPPQS